MKIGELARAARSSVETVRYYEKEGLLPPAARSPSNYREYSGEHLERLRFIRNCRALDMSHDEIRALLRLATRHDEDCSAINTVFDEHIAHVAERIRELEQLRATLITLRQRCQHGQPADACGILHGIAEMQDIPPAGRHTHL